MSRKPELTSRGVQRLTERERSVGLDQEDAAAQWLAEHGAEPAPPPAKAASKSKELHRFRQRKARPDR